MTTRDDTVSKLIDLEPRETNDVCTLVLARRLAALLDRDPAFLAPGVPLPHGWHVMLFNPPARQSQLRPDGGSMAGRLRPGGFDCVRGNGG